MNHWPQWTFLALLGLSLLITIAKNGEPREPYNSGMALGNFCLVMFILYFGGFFQAVGWGP